MGLGELQDLGLYDPDAPNAEERRALLLFLLGQGISAEEMLEADRNGRLVGLAGDRLLRSPGPYLTEGEVASRADISPEKAARLWRACGFPDPGPDARIFTEDDVEMLGTVTRAETLFGEDATLQLTRVVASSLSRVAEAVITAVSVNRDAPLVASGASELEAARSSADSAALLPQLDQVMGCLLRRHLAAVNNARFELAFPSPGTDTVDLAVGFADLVGSTALSLAQPSGEWAAAVTELEGRATDAALGRGGRIVKTIGDEVMFVASDVASGCEIVLELLEAFAADDDLPTLRGGVAVGEVLARDGDYHGPVVSLASRATKLARPDTVLVSEPVQERCRARGAAYRFTPLSPRRLKGFDHRVRLFALSRE